MNVGTQDLSILHLIANASLLVQLVMAGLLLASLFSWYYIFRKVIGLRRANQQCDEFEKDFWSGGDLNELYQAAVNSRHGSGGMERIFEAGYREFTKLRKQPGQDIAPVMEGTRRAMKATYQRELEFMESHLSFLASVGSLHLRDGLSVLANQDHIAIVDDQELAFVTLDDLRVVQIRDATDLLAIFVKARDTRFVDHPPGSIEIGRALWRERG